MKIAVTSQNRKSVTGHAGKCRKFWIYEVEGRKLRGKSLLELPIEQSFHETHGVEAHPLDKVNVLISGGMGAGLRHRLWQRGIDALVTPETDPDRAVAAYLAGSLALGEPDHDGHGHEHHHGHRAGAVFAAGPGIPILHDTGKETS
ncbi:MAG TPA: NifB/NifX family molybdenum-iron cluster-binding protein [Thiobacillaceae bacterium]|nr:NifB/NifX family molybdenum-iron cluster-binding protein [Thiobacillaceae bacterium]